MVSVGSVQFLITPCSSLHFSISIGPFRCSRYYLQGFESVAPVPSEAGPFVYLASVCRSLQCLISALTQGGGGGLLFRLTCSSCWREGGALQTNLTGLFGEHSQCCGHTGFAPAHGVCASPVYTFQAPGCSTGSRP